MYQTKITKQVKRKKKAGTGLLKGMMIFFGVLNLLAVTCTLARNGSRRDGGPREDIA